MKLISSLIIGLLSVTLLSCSNSISPQDVPAALTSWLLTTFPDATAVEWEENGDHYEAEFMVNQKAHEALVNAAGEILMYKYEVAETEFPATVMTSINQKYNGMETDEFSKLFKDGTAYYLVEIDEANKIFSEDGQEQTNIPVWD